MSSEVRYFVRRPMGCPMLVTMYSTVLRVKAYFVSFSGNGAGGFSRERGVGKVPLNSFPERIFEMW